MFKKIKTMYQSWRDRRFANRLNRVLRTHVLEATIIIDGDIIASGSIKCYLPKEQIEEIKAGNKALEV